MRSLTRPTWRPMRSVLARPLAAPLAAPAAGLVTVLIMALVFGVAAQAGPVAGLLGGPADADGSHERPEPRPDWLPERLPLPADATFTFALPTHTGELAAYVYVRRPVADVIKDLQDRLADSGWRIIGQRRGITWTTDLQLTVQGHGQTWTVRIEPSVGSTSASNVIYSPAPIFQQ